MLDYIDLLDSEPIHIEGIGHIRIPKLREVKRSQKTFNMHLGILSLTVDKCLASLASESDVSLPSDVTLYDLITRDVTMRGLFEDTLSHFVCEDIEWSIDNESWLVSNEDQIIGTINHANFDILRKAILESNFCKMEEDGPARYKNESAKRIAEKLKKGREIFNRNKKESSGTSLGDIISSLSIMSHSYNLFNIWDLTIYQLHDQFMRQCIKNQVDILGYKWAAWGTDKFDFSEYYKSFKGKNTGGKL